MNKLTMPENVAVDSEEKGNFSPRLRPFFSPRGVAVIGASPKPGNQGKRIVESLLAQGFKGTIATVHPKGLEVSPVVPVARSVDELPKETDLAIVAVSASNVPGLVEPLAKRGVRHLIVISGGFAETGGAGAKLQEELRVAGKKFGARVIGPNCLGVFSAPDRFNSLFLSAREISLPQPGPVAIISQSGALMSLMLDRLAGLGIGVQRAVNFGNRVDVDESELIEEFAGDPAIRAIGLYLEGVCDGQRFVETARRAARSKPVVVWKGGHGGRGSAAAHAHSAALAGSYEAFQAACAKAGLIEVQGFQEFHEAIEVLALQPPPKGNRTLIVSNGGGMGVFLADLCEKAGLNAPAPSENALARVRPFLPDYYSLKNPVDLTGSGTNEQCVFAVDQLLKSGEFDCLLMVLLSGSAGITPEIAPLLKDRLPRSVPVVLGAYGQDLLSRLRETLGRGGVPTFASGEEAARAAAVLVRRGQLAREFELSGDGLDADWFDTLPTYWPKWTPSPTDEMENKNFLRECGVRVPESARVQSREDIETAIQTCGFPLVLKIASREIKHKTEIKGIRLGLSDRESLIVAWEEMSRLWPGKVWAERQMPPGLDLMVGAHRDPQFGPILVFGTGGSFVEIYRDIARVLLPATVDELSDMIFRTAAGRIIGGIRGEPPLDEARLIAFLKLVSDWMVREPGLESLDFNPVRLYKEGLTVLDAKAALRPREERSDGS